MITGRIIGGITSSLIGGIVRLPEWILERGFWNDGGIWKDNEKWID